MSVYWWVGWSNGWKDGMSQYGKKEGKLHVQSTYRSNCSYSRIVTRLKAESAY